MNKIRNWSEFLSEKQHLPSKIYYPGEQFVYDSGILPVGITANQGDILSLVKEPGMTAYQVPGVAADWLVIRNSGTTQQMIDTSFANAGTLQPGQVVANLGNAASVLPKTTIPEFFRQLPLKFLLDYYGYGACRKRSQTDPSWSRCGNPLMAISLPLHDLKRCLVSDEGHVLAYLDATDSSKLASGGIANLSGVKDPENPGSPFGQVMVEIPECFRYHFVADGIEYVYLSAESFPVDETVEKVHIPAGCFYSAYEAAMDRSGEEDKLASVVNTSEEFIGGTGNTELEGDKDLHGRPVTNISLSNFRKSATRRGEGWHCDTYFLFRHVYWLFVTEYLTSNSQSITAIGEGVTTWTGTAWNNFNSYNPFIPCGKTNALGNASGKVEHTLESVDMTFYVPSYRGIENPFGHIWSKCDGILVNSANGRNAVYVCNNPQSFADTLNEDYKLIGYAPTANNYYKEQIPGHPIAQEGSATASATTGMCDQFYAPSANAGIRGLLFGGHASYGTFAGLSSAAAANAPSYVIATHGSRLCYLPF